MELPEVGEKFLVRQASGILDGLMEYREMMMAYSCAIKEVKTKNLMCWIQNFISVTNEIRSARFIPD